jgi:large subunit ribosomal protein L3
MKFILGKKLGMSQIFDKEGRVIPVTLIEAGPCLVVQVKTKEKDGYEAVQIGFGERKAKNIKKPQKGHLEKAKNQKLKVKSIRWLREFRTEKPEEFKLGDEIKVDVFKEGEVVKVSGISKGKGFQGVVKRHGFSGFPASHGTKHGLRAPGSIGSAFPERVWKGKKMAGRMGGNRVTVQGLKIVQIDKEDNLLAIKGAVPGRKGMLLEIVATKEIEAAEREKEPTKNQKEEKEKQEQEPRKEEKKEEEKSK